VAAKDVAHRWLLGTAAVAAEQMTIIAVADGATRAGYDPYRNWVSQLSLGAGGRVGVVNLALCAGWLIAFAIGLHLHLPPSRTARWTVRFVLVCGVGFAVVAAFPIDPGLGYPPGLPAVHSLRGIVHQAGALLLFAGGTAAAVLIGRCLRHTFAPAARLGVLVAGIMVVSFVAASVLVTLDVLDVLPGTPSGLLERVALFTGMGWLGVAGLCLLLGPAR
jgi:hypothetical protein